LSLERKISAAQTLKLNKLEEEILESKGVFENAFSIDNNMNLNSMRLHEIPAIIKTYSDFDNMDNNLFGAENETGFLNSPKVPMPAFAKALSKKLTL
jgi:hypothetical protein